MTSTGFYQAHVLRMKFIIVTLFYIFVWSARIVLSEATFKYRLEYSSYVGEVQDERQTIVNKEAADIHICRLSEEEKLKVCEGALHSALEHPLANRSNIQLVYLPQVHEEKVYEFALTGLKYIKKPPLVTAACLCSTSPPIYLRDSSVGNFVDVYVAFRDFYVKQVVKSANFSFKFEHVVYAKSTLAPVKFVNTILRICQMQEEEKLQMCREALAQPYAQAYGINYVEGYGKPLFEERMYEMKLADFEHTFKAPLFVAACMCPTMPPSYLRARYTGKDFTVYVVLRDELALSEAGFSR